MGKYLATMTPTTNGYDRAALVATVAETEYRQPAGVIMRTPSGDIMPSGAQQYSSACSVEKVRIMQEIATQSEINHYDTLFNLAASLSVQLSEATSRFDADRVMYEQRIIELNTYVAELRCQMSVLRQENLKQYERLITYDRKEFDIRKTVGFNEEEKIK